MTKRQEQIAIAEMVGIISSSYALRIEQWRDEYGHYRVGIDWYSEKDYLVVIEKPTLYQALSALLVYIVQNHEKPAIQKKLTQSP